jgi:hypothetical protein
MCLQTAKAVRETLQKLNPQTAIMTEAFACAYRNTMERIENQKDQARQLAIDILSWVTYEKRLITPAELRHALAVSANSRSSKLEKVYDLDADHVITICAG